MKKPVLMMSRPVSSRWPLSLLLRSGVRRPDVFDPCDEQNICSFSLKALRYSFCSADRGFKRHVTRSEHMEILGRRYAHLHGILPMFIGEKLPKFETPSNLKRPLYGVAGDVKDAGNNRRYVPAVTLAGGHILGTTRSSSYGAFPAIPGLGNPYDPKLTGSSSGGAVSVASGISAFSVGSNGGGSVRLPAAWCGIHGMLLEPDLPLRSKAGERRQTLITDGLMTRTVHDMAIVLDSVTDDERGGIASHEPDTAAEGSVSHSEVGIDGEILPIHHLHQLDPPSTSFEHMLGVPRQLRILVTHSLTDEPANPIIAGYPAVQVEKPPMWDLLTKHLSTLSVQSSSLQFHVDPTIRLPNIVQAFLVNWMNDMRRAPRKKPQVGVPSMLGGETSDLGLSDDDLVTKYITKPFKSFPKGTWEQMTVRSKAEINAAVLRLRELLADFDMIMTPACLGSPWSVAYAALAFGPSPRFLAGSPSVANVPDGMTDARFNPYLPLFNILQSDGGDGVAITGPAGIDGNAMPTGYQIGTVATKPREATHNLLAVAQFLEKAVVGRVIPPVFPNLWLGDPTLPLVPETPGMAANFNDPFSF
jgi:Asp-tRNA(Asn)/Glu-tRNA(Gln) amidotransferase A subunit family amidase